MLSTHPETDSPVRVAVIFLNVGGYHAARLRAAQSAAQDRGWSLTAIQVTPSTQSVEVGQTARLAAQVTSDPGVDQTVQWRSSDPTVATVDASNKAANAVVFMDASSWTKRRRVRRRSNSARNKRGADVCAPPTRVTTSLPPAPADRVR